MTQTIKISIVAIITTLFLASSARPAEACSGYTPSPQSNARAALMTHFDGVFSYPNMPETERAVLELEGFKTTEKLAYALVNVTRDGKTEYLLVSLETISNYEMKIENVDDAPLALRIVFALTSADRV